MQSPVSGARRIMIFMDSFLSLTPDVGLGLQWFLARGAPPGAGIFAGAGFIEQVRIWRGRLPQAPAEAASRLDASSGHRADFVTLDRRLAVTFGAFLGIDDESVALHRNRRIRAFKLAKAATRAGRSDDLVGHRK